MYWREHSTVPAGTPQMSLKAWNRVLEQSSERSSDIQPD
jgi:hypothetical protein